MKTFYVQVQNMYLQKNNQLTPDFSLAEKFSEIHSAREFLKNSVFKLVGKVQLKIDDTPSILNNPKINDWIEWDGRCTPVKNFIPENDFQEIKNLNNLADHIDRPNKLKSPSPRTKSPKGALEIKNPQILNNLFQVIDWKSYWNSFQKLNFEFLFPVWEMEKFPGIHEWEKINLMETKFFRIWSLIPELENYSSIKFNMVNYKTIDVKFEFLSEGVKIYFYQIGKEFFLPVFIMDKDGCIIHNFLK